jgi:outer membrane protein OmpA-like peptidoglycan-associated protein
MKKNITLFLAFLFFVSFSFSQKKKRSFKKEFYFATASYDLDSIEMTKAKKYFKLIDKFNLTKIEIYGFADSDGNEKANLKLSQNRINTLADLLKEKGHDVEQKMEAKGEENPVYKNDTDEKFKNRRVEVIAYFTNKKKNKSTKVKQALVVINEEKKISIDDFKTGTTISLPSLQFYGGTTNFLPGAEDVLKNVIPILISNPTLKIKIKGHVCCKNDLKLSILRAQVVYDYLIKYGVDKEMLKYRGYSNSKPGFGNVSDPRNRRVELMVL